VKNVKKYIEDNSKDSNDYRKKEIKSIKRNKQDRETFINTNVNLEISFDSTEPKINIRNTS
jgi:hypothetical protein